MGMDGVEHSAEAVIAKTEAQVIRALRPVLLTLAVPGTVAFAALEFFRGSGSPWLPLMVAAAIVMALAIRGQGKAHATTAVSVGLVSYALGAYLHFGPLLGVGLLFAGAALLVSFLHGKRGALASLTALSGVVLASAIGSQLELFSIRNAPTGPEDWIRLNLTTFGVLTSIVFVNSRLQQFMRQAVIAEFKAEDERDQARRERERALEAARAAQQLEAVGRVASGVAHDFNNSLLVLQGTIEMLEEPMPADERGQLVSEGVAAISAAAATTRQLLGFVRRERAELSACSPGPVIERFVRTMARVLPESVSLAAAVQPCPDLPIPASTLDQIILNLVLNARDAIDGQGTILVGCARAANGDGQLIVRDTGEGMDPAVAERVFEPFFSTKGEGGTGLGLATIHELVRQSGGQIHLDTAPGEGSTFTFAWPEIVKIIEAEGSARLRSTLRLDLNVLLVEDQPEVARVMQRSLHAAGCTTSLATSVGQARALLDSHLADHPTARFDLLCTDGLLPDGTAADVLRAYRQRIPEGAALVFTGYADQPELRDLVRREGLPLLHKPFSPQELLAHVHAASQDEAKAS